LNNFYTYVYLDPRKPGIYNYGEYKFDYEPFYVGKGKGNRLKNINGRSKYFKRIINKIKELELEPVTIKLKENLEETESFKLEIELIKLIGKKNLKEGPLTNLVDGGEGSSGYICSEKTLEKLRKKYSIIKKGFEKIDYKLLTEEKDYKNNKQKLEYKCPRGHRGSISWNNFQRDHGCPICSNILIHEKQRKKYLDVHKEANKKNYKILMSDGEYINAHQKLKYKCPKDHKFLMRRNDFQQGKGCPICFNESRSKKMRGKNSILIIQNIIEIKLLLKEGNLFQREIADIFYVKRKTISDIKNNKIWKYIKI